MANAYRCWAEIDLDALRQNLAWIRHRVGRMVKIMTVVKADAYGHGLKPIAALLMQSGTDIFGVANLREALAVRSVGRGWPILMLGAALPEEVDLAVRESVMLTLSTWEEAQQFSKAATRRQRRLQVHLKVDTGMGRLGAPPKAAAELARRVAQLPGLELVGLYTHFSSAEDSARFTRQQKRLFEGLLQRIEERWPPLPWVHAGNSAAVLFEPDSWFNLVRPGLLVYGILPAGRRKAAAGLSRQFRPALSWKCRVSLVKDVPRGAPLSYGRTFVTPRKMRIATVTAGYGDGYLRAASNRAQVLIGGRRCPVVGRVTMDQMLVDVSRGPAPGVGDEVVLIGRQGGQEISARELADWTRTIPWEVLTNITYRVPRIYLGGQAS